METNDENVLRWVLHPDGREGKEGHRPHIVIEPSKYGSTEVTIILAGQLFCGIKLAQGSCGFVSCRRQLITLELFPIT